MHAKPRGRWLQFRLRTSFILIAIIAAWLGVKLNDARRHKQALESLKALGAELRFRSDESTLERWLQPHSGPLISWVSLENPKATDADLACLAAIPELQSLHLLNVPISDTGFRTLYGLERLMSLGVIFGGEITDDALAQLEDKASLMNLCVSPAPKVTDAGVAHLRGLNELRSLDLSGTQITDAGLKHLANMTEIKRLYLSDTTVTDDGLKQLSGLVNLEWLGLVNTPVTGRGLSHLKRCKKLDSLFLSRSDLDDEGLQWARSIASVRVIQAFETRVTDAGVKRLQQAAPKIKVGRGPFSHATASSDADEFP